MTELHAPRAQVSSWLERLDSSFERIRARFNLREDMRDEASIIGELTRGSEINGTNLWLLISAILIASVGLNVNSTAVIIGAMLISPLMGPILGISLGVATYRIRLVQSAGRSLGYAVAASVLASTAYFLISPLSEAQSELLARTQPSVWDVLIALIGGLAGMVGISRRQPGNVIPGVAIATALMPPLCTAGFGLATAQWEYFLGAFYLFFINSVFICLGGILILKFLGLHREELADKRSALLLRRSMIAIVVITALPSVFLTYRIVRESLFRAAANRYVAQELTAQNVAIVSRDFLRQDDRPVIQLTYLGSPLADSQIEALRGRLARYGLANAQLILKPVLQDRPEQALLAMKSGVIEELLERTRASADAKDLRIQELERKLSTLNDSEDTQRVGQELAVQIPGLRTYSLARTAVRGADGQPIPDQWILAGTIQSRRPISPTERQRIREWLKVRFNAQRADLFFDAAPAR